MRLDHQKKTFLKFKNYLIYYFWETGRNGVLVELLVLRQPITQLLLRDLKSNTPPTPLKYKSWPNQLFLENENNFEKFYDYFLV